MKKVDSRFSKTQMPNLSITDLPSTIFADIMLKSSAKAVATCKCVCKTWLALVSDPQFAKLYSAQSNTHTLIRDIYYRNISRSLYLFEPDHDREFEDLYCLSTSRNKTEVKTKLKIPLRNVQAMLDRIDDDDGDINNTKFFSVGFSGEDKENLIMLSPSDDHPQYVVANSCDGFLCLSGRGDNRVLVCNPITGEFFYLPETPSFNEDGVLYSDCGFGFSPKHNRYKVIMLSTRESNDPVTGSEGYSAEVVGIITVGSCSWRSIDSLGFKLQYKDPPSYLNGALYWVSKENDERWFLASFDLDDEKFKVHSIPSWPIQEHELPPLRTEVVGGRLYLYNTEAIDQVDIWAANELGGSLGWTRLFSIDFSEIQDTHGWCPYRVLCFVSNEEVVLFGGPDDEFIYYDQSRGVRYKQLKFRGFPFSLFEVINFTPSFVSLKDIGLPGNIEVLNVNSVNGCEK